MFFEHRTYTLHPQRARAYLQLVESKGLPLLGPMLPHMRGYFVSEFGPLNQVVHIYKYDSLEQRAQIRSEIASNPAFPEYAEALTPLIASMESKILLPAPFSPLKD